MILWGAAAVAVVAIGEAAFIGRLLYTRSSTPPPGAVIETRQPGANVWLNGLPAEIRSLQLKGTSGTQSAVPAEPGRNATAVATTPDQKGKSVTANNRLAGAVASQRSGGFRLFSPIEVHVLDGERVLGSSNDGPILAPAGRHEFEFVNSSIGYRVREIVDVTAGQIGSLSITVPNGRLNINAVPWAAVSIDGTSYGETPLGNVSIAAGEHEIVFRHPQFGERREKTIVRADGLTRISVDLQQ
jgi:hypothetical protein